MLKNKRKKKILVLFSVLFVLFGSTFFTMITIPDQIGGNVESKSLNTSSYSSLIHSGMTIDSYSNLVEGQAYDFQSYIYDPSNITREFQSGFLQTEESNFGNVYNTTIIEPMENENVINPEDNYIMSDGIANGGGSFDSSSITSDYEYDSGRPIIYDTRIEEEFSSEESYMDHEYYPDGYDSDYSVSGGDLDMENGFPSYDFDEGDEKDLTEDALYWWGLESGANTTSNEFGHRNYASGIGNFAGSVYSGNIANTRYDDGAEYRLRSAYLSPGWQECYFRINFYNPYTQPMLFKLEIDLDTLTGLGIYGQYLTVRADSTTGTILFSSGGSRLNQILVANWVSKTGFSTLWVHSTMGAAWAWEDPSYTIDIDVFVMGTDPAYVDSQISNLEDVDFLGNQSWNGNDTYQAYNGTMNFENETIGSTPSYWTDSSSGLVIDYEADNYNSKSLRQYEAGAHTIYSDFQETSNGTIEFFWKMSRVDESNQIRIENSGTYAILFCTESNQFLRHNGVDWETFGAPTPVSNQWYKISIDYECGNGSYKGLSQWEWQMTLDDVLYSDDFEFANEVIPNRFRTYLSTGWDNRYIWLDSLEYSWNDYYYENKSFDLELFNWTDSEPFKCDLYDLAGGTVEIVDDYDGHQTVLEIDDTNSGQNVEMYQYLQDYNSSGNIEFWMQTDDATDNNQIRLLDTEGNSINLFRIYTDKWQWNNGAWLDISGTAPVDNTWYHIRIGFECTTNGYHGLGQYEWELYIDGVNRTDATFTITAGRENVSIIRYSTGTSNINKMFIDAVDYSWSTGYYLNRNYDYTNDIDTVSFSNARQILTNYHSFLNRYDSSDYINNFDITITFQHKFTPYSNGFITDAYTQIGTESKRLITADTSWYDFSYTFTNVSSDGDMYARIKCRNGLLEFRHVYLSFTFQCLYNNSGDVYTNLQQSFNMTENWHTDNLTQYVADNGEFHLNTTYDLSFNTDSLTYKNLYGRQNILEINYDIKANDTWHNDVATHYTNTTGVSTFSYNVSSFLQTNNYTEFQGFDVKILLIGDSSLTVSDFILCDRAVRISAKINFTLNTFIGAYWLPAPFNFTYIFTNNITQTVKISTWKTTFPLQWETINETTAPPTIQNWTTSSIDDYLNYTYYFKIKVEAQNWTYNFDLNIDFLYRFFDSVFIDCNSTFDQRTIWRYRYILDSYGVEFATDWIMFDVVAPESNPNIKMISESEQYTRWDYYESDASITEIYTEDFDYNPSYDWSLTGVGSSNFYDTRIPTDDSYTIYYSDLYVTNPYGDNNYGSSSTMSVDWYIFLVWTSYMYSFLKFDSWTNPYDYCTWNMPDTTILNYYITTASSGNNIYNYETSSFDEDTITWNNQPSIGSYLGTTSGTSTGWKSLGMSGINDELIFQLRASANALGSKNIATKESNYDPYLSQTLRKSYQNGQLMFQTNTNEEMTLESPDDLNLDLQENDKIDVTFNTTSSEKIDLWLMNDGVLVKEYEVSEQDNIHFNTRTVSLSIDEDIGIIDQIIINTVADENDITFVDKIRFYRYETDVFSYYLDPDGLEEIFLEFPADYTIDIFENNILRETKTITTSETKQILIFERIVYQPVYITFYDSNNEYLDFYDFTTYVNYTLGGSDYIEQRLTSNLMYVDIDTQIVFNVYDSFDENVVTDYITYSQTFIDFNLDVYTLQIKNEAEKYCTYSLEKGGSSIEKTGLIPSQEIMKYTISTGNYVFNYTNLEDSSQHSLNFSFYEHELIIINSTYKEIYFSIFSYDGLGLDRDLVRFYINDERNDFGFNTITTENISLLILDFFNNTLYNETVSSSGLTEYNMFVEIYTLNIINLFVFDDLKVNITQGNSGIWMSQVIPNEMSMPYRFLPNINYTIVAKYTNDTIYEQNTINLTSNGQIESFGVTEEYPPIPEDPEFPKDVYISVYESTGMGIDFNMVKLYINGSRTDFGFNTFEVEMSNLTVLDFFDTVLFSQNINMTGIYEYNIEITLYSFKMKNEASKYVNYSIQFGLHITDGYILPEEIIEYQLSPNTYYFNYTNTENNVLYINIVNLTQDNLFVIPSTYRDIYFSLYTYDGFGISHDTIKFYVNGSRRDLGFNTIESEMVNLTIYDFFDNLLYSNIVNCYDLEIPEYSIYIEIYTMSVVNLYKGTDLRIVITQDHTDINMSVVISSQTNIPFRLVPDLEYTIKAYDLNDTFVEKQEFDLEDNNMVINFGFYEETITVIPTPFDPADYMAVFWAFIIVFCIAIAIMVLYLRFRAEMRQVPLEVKDKYKKKKIKSFDNRLIENNR